MRRPPTVRGGFGSVFDPLVVAYRFNVYAGQSRQLTNRYLSVREVVTTRMGKALLL